ncbi:MAG TPA: DUF3280 domain-containing protein [Afifellaceae bacterium]|nr:DUF3280 domain-containing protein [Afifellaceae bacterium]
MLVACIARLRGGQRHSLAVEEAGMKKVVNEQEVECSAKQTAAIQAEREAYTPEEPPLAGWEAERKRFYRDRIAAVLVRGARGLVVAVLIAGFALLIEATSAMAQGPAPQHVAIFDFELIDTLQGQLGGASQAEQARLAGLGDTLRGAYAAAPGYSVADIGPVREEAIRRRLHSCRGCGRRLAAELGADLAVTGTVQKVSELILNINIYIRDVETGRLVKAASADIRGNTDESWRRGLAWLIDNRLDLAPGQ